MKFSLACISAVIAPVAVVAAVGEGKESSSVQQAVNDNKKDVLTASSSSFSSSYSRTKNSDVFKRLVQRRDVRDEVRNEPNKLKNVGKDDDDDDDDELTECSPAVNKNNKIDAGHLPASSCGEKQICIARDDSKTTGVCVSVDDVPASYWETDIYGSSSDDEDDADADDFDAAASPARRDLQLVDLCIDVKCKNIQRPEVANQNIRNLVNECVDINTGRFINGGSCPYSGDIPIQCWDTSNVTDMSYAFYNHTKSRISVQCWNTSRVTNMASMFQNAEKFNHDLSRWDVSNVQNFNSMFYNSEKFNYNLKEWNTKSASNMAYMFGYAENFNQPIGDWYTGDVTDMKFMFYGSKAFDFDINGWDTGKVTDLKGTFSQAYKLSSNLNSWNTANVQNMNYTFFYAYYFNSPLDGWDTSQVTSMDGTFSKARDFNQPIGDWDVSQVTSMNNLFAGEYYDENYEYGITSFNSNINAWDVSRVTSMSGMFYTNGAKPYLTAKLDQWNTSQVTDMKYMFHSAYFYGSGYINNFDTSKVQNMTAMFYDTSFGFSPENDINGWKTSNVRDMDGMFAACDYFDDNDINGWDVSLVTSMKSMFYNATFNQTVEDWNVGNVKNMSSMFYNSNFNKPLDKWNLNKDVDMSYMFEYAYYFNQCLSTWAGKTSGEDVVDMFNGTSCPGEPTPPSTGPWCQTEAQGCVAAEPEEPSFGCDNDDTFVTVKGKDCKGLLNRLKPKALRTTCGKSFNTQAGDERLVSEACPALCNPDECCKIDKDFTAVLKKGNKKCKKLLEPLKKQPDKLKTMCERTVPTTSLGDVVVKNHCSNFCNTGCKPPINCNDKSVTGNAPKLLLVPNKLEGTTAEMTCDEFFEGKNSAKVCKKKKLRLKGGKKKPVQVKKHCPHICNNACKAQLE